MKQSELLLKRIYTTIKNCRMPIYKYVTTEEMQIYHELFEKNILAFYIEPTTKEVIVYVTNSGMDELLTRFGNIPEVLWFHGFSSKDELFQHIENYNYVYNKISTVCAKYKTSFIELPIKELTENDDIKTLPIDVWVYCKMLKGEESWSDEIKHLDETISLAEKIAERTMNREYDELLNKITSNGNVSNESEKESVIQKDKRLETAKTIKDYLDQNVYGQEDAKEKAAILLWSHLNGHRRTSLFAGPSGSGKTEIFRQLKKLYPNIFICDSSDISTEGFSGRKKYYTILSNILSNGVSIHDLEHSIIVLDEFDKLCTPTFNASGENISRNIQGQLLTMIEGSDIMLKEGVSVNTSNITFVFLGAFEDIYIHRAEEKHIGFGKELRESEVNEITVDELIRFGVRTELAGRISIISQLKPLSQEDYYQILKNSNISPIRKTEKEYGIKLNINEEELRRLAKEAEEQKLGVRWLQSQIQIIGDELIFSF